MERKLQRKHNYRGDMREENKKVELGSKRRTLTEQPSSYTAKSSDVATFILESPLLTEAVRKKATENLDRKVAKDGNNLTREVKVNSLKEQISESETYNLLLARMLGHLEIATKNTSIDPAVNTIVSLLRVKFALRGVDSTINQLIYFDQDNNITSPALRRKSSAIELITEQLVQESKAHLGYSFQRTGETKEGMMRYYGHSEQAMVFDILNHKENIIAEIISQKNQITDLLTEGMLIFNGRELGAENEIERIEFEFIAHSLNEVCTTCQHYIFDTFEILKKDLEQELELAGETNIDIDHYITSSHYYQYVGRTDGDRMIAPLKIWLELLYENNAENFAVYINTLLEEHQKVTLANALRENENLYDNFDNLYPYLPREIADQFDRNIALLRTSMEQVFICLGMNHAHPEFIPSMAYYLGRIARTDNEAGKEIFFKFSGERNDQVLHPEEMQKILEEVTRLSTLGEEIEQCKKYKRNMYRDKPLNPGVMNGFEIDEHLTELGQYAKAGFSGLTMSKEGKRSPWNPRTPTKDPRPATSHTTPGTRKALLQDKETQTIDPLRSAMCGDDEIEESQNSYTARLALFPKTPPRKTTSTQGSENQKRNEEKETAPTEYNLDRLLRKHSTKYANLETHNDTQQPVQLRKQCAEVESPGQKTATGRWSVALSSPDSVINTIGFS